MVEGTGVQSWRVPSREGSINEVDIRQAFSVRLRIKQTASCASRAFRISLTLNVTDGILTTTTIN
jgi:hypothetical protein